MERQRREEELKGRSSKKAVDAEQSILNRVWEYLFLFFKNLFTSSKEATGLSFLLVIYIMYALNWIMDQMHDRNF